MILLSICGTNTWLLDHSGDMIHINISTISFSLELSHTLGVRAGKALVTESEFS